MRREMVKRVLVLTNSRDGLNTLAVTDKIEELGHEVVRMDVDLVTKGLNQLSLAYGPDTSAVLTVGSKEIDLLSEVDTVWFRRPYTFDFTIKDPVQLKVAEEEVRDVLDGLWLLLQQKYWVSDPAAITKARLKPYQLKVAAEFGLHVPVSLITNDPVRAKSFASSQPTVFKPMTGYSFDYGDRTETAFTTLLTDQHIEQLHVVKAQHVLLQHCIEKHHELRVTFAGGKFFTCRFDLPDYESVVDWRYPENAEIVQYTEAKLPEEIELKTRHLLEKLNLKYAAVDFAVDAQGNFFFLEVNPIGQWLWIEEESGLKISAAIAAELIEGGEKK
jgi:glutathione synthase/RimK-type ligase-like ATP-grasp enzyme